MFGRMMMAQVGQPAIAMTIKSGGAISRPVTIAQIEGVGGRGLQWLFNEAIGWAAADLVPYFSDDAVPVPTGGTEALIRGDYQTDGSTAATWWPLEDKAGTTIRITSIPTAGGSVLHLRALHPEFWAYGTWKYMRFVSTNTASLATVNQTGDKTFWIKPLY